MKVLLVTFATLIALSHGQRRWFSTETESWVPASPLVEPSNIEATNVESSSSDSSSSGVEVEESSSSTLNKPSSALSALADEANAEKPEAFLVHLKPKSVTQGKGKSKFLLLLRLPDGTTETIGAGASVASPETLNVESSQNQNQVPSSDESQQRANQQTQQLQDDNDGFDDQNAPIQQQQQQQQQQEEDMSQQVQQQQFDDSAELQQQQLEQVRENPADYTQQRQNLEESPRSQRDADNRQVPVILIALPPDANPFGNSGRLSNIINQLRAPGAGTKGGNLRAGTKSGPTALPQPRGQFGGYGNSHTPSPAGGYGSVAMRLAAKGIAPPTSRRPEEVKATIASARDAYPSKGGRPAAVKGRPAPVRDSYAAQNALSSGNAYPTKGQQPAPLREVKGAARAASAGGYAAPARASAAGGYSAPATKGRPSRAQQEGTKEPARATAAGAYAEPARATAGGYAAPAPVRKSPAAIVKGRAAAAGRSQPPAYSSSENSPVREENPRVVEEASRPLFDDEVDDGLPSRLLGGGYQPSDVAVRESVREAVTEREFVTEVPTTTTVEPNPIVTRDVRVPTAEYFSNSRAGKRVVLLLFNKGELDPTAAESIARRTIYGY